jgi:hypothetical protein
MHVPPAWLPDDLANMIPVEEAATWRQEAHDLRLSVHVWRARTLRALDEIDRLRQALNEAQERSIEARNPGIDMDEVRRIRAGGK